MKFKILCIFCPTGRTFTFRNVEIVSDNETVLEFTYSAMSDGFKKRGIFLKNNIVGWSLTD